MRRPAPPRTGVMELLTVAAIAGALLGLALVEAQPILAKARASGALMLARQPMLDQTLLAAESGLLGPAAGAQGGRTVDAVDRALAALPDDTLVAELAQRRGRGAAAPEEGSLQAIAEPPFVVVQGTLREGEAELRLSWTPAISLAPPAPAVVLWLCGDRPPPPGWLALRDPEPQAPPGAFGFSICRADPA